MCEKITYVATPDATKTEIIMGKAKAFYQNNKTPILIIGAVVILYFLMKKKVIPMPPL